MRPRSPGACPTPYSWPTKVMWRQCSRERHPADRGLRQRRRLVLVPADRRAGPPGGRCPGPRVRRGDRRRWLHGAVDRVLPEEGPARPADRDPGAGVRRVRRVRAQRRLAVGRVRRLAQAVRRSPGPPGGDRPAARHVPVGRRGHRGGPRGGHRRRHPQGRAGARRDQPRPAAPAARGAVLVAYLGVRGGRPPGAVPATSAGTAAGGRGPWRPRTPALRPHPARQAGRGLAAAVERARA